MCLCSGGGVFGPGFSGSLMVETDKGRREHLIIFLLLWFLFELAFMATHLYTKLRLKHKRRGREG